MKNIYCYDPVRFCHCEPRRGAAISSCKSGIASPSARNDRKGRPGKMGEPRLNFRAGFTLIELVMIILITGILSMAGVHIMQFVIQNSFYLPNQVQADLVAAEALEIMVEGDSQAKGLRFCKEVTTAGANQVVVTNQDDQTITYDLSGGNLYRAIAPGAAEQIPYFKAADMTITGSGAGSALFTYYDSADAVTAVPANVRRINIDLIAQNGTGSSDKYEGTSQQSSSVKVNKYL